MFTRYLISSLSVGLLGLVACNAAPASDAGDASAGEPDRGSIGKADLVGSCRDSCGGKSKAGWCYCDDVCQDYGDCCHDHVAQCGDASCADGLVDCDGVCIDPLSDATSCGASADCQGGNAGVSCDPEEACVSGLCRGWLGDQLIQDDVLGDAGSPRVAIDANGNVVAVWTQQDGQTGQTWFNRYDAATHSWDTPTRIGAELSSTASPSVAIAPDSSAIVLLTSRENSSGNQRWVLRATRYDWQSDTWTPPEAISSEGSAIFGSIVMDPQGNATATWSENIAAPRRHDRWANRFDAAAGAWGEPERIEADDSAEAYDRGALVADPAGNVTALWNSMDGDGHRDIWANRYSIEDRRWGDAQRVEDQVDSAWHPEAAVDASGNVVAVWSMQELPAQVLATRYDATAGGWQDVQVINLEGELRASLPHVGVDPDGNAITVWYQHDGTGWNVWSNRYDAGSGTWGVPETIEQTDSTARVPSVGVDEFGNATVVWIQHDVVSSLHTRRFDSASGAWGPAARLQVQDGYVERFEVVVNPAGVGATVMLQRAGDRWTVRSNRYE